MSVYVVTEGHSAPSVHTSLRLAIESWYSVVSHGRRHPVSIYRAEIDGSAAAEFIACHNPYSNHSWSFGSDVAFREFMEAKEGLW